MFWYELLLTIVISMTYFMLFFFSNKNDALVYDWVDDTDMHLLYVCFCNYNKNWSAFVNKVVGL